MTNTNYTGAMKKLVADHSDGLDFAAEINKIAEQGDQDALKKGIEMVQRYNIEELESHLQHEEQAILAPLVEYHPQHLALCVTIGKEHGYIRSLVEEMTIETAKKDLSDFSHILTKHTLMENEQLFPVIEKLFTQQQLHAIASFTPFNRQPITDTPLPISNQQPPNNNEHNEWLVKIMDFYNNTGQQGGSILLFPRFNPEIIEQIAEQTGLDFFDYQQEVMEEYGQDADSISFEQLTNSLYNRAKYSNRGIISHNVEALLCVKPEAERKIWLQAFLNADWPNPIFLPLSIYQADAPNEHPKVCDLELHKVPRNTEKIHPTANNRTKYYTG
ncbi:MAG: hemerythrin domain-containing protein [Gammaproteobacteria bacterium]|nr:hemerythrin domain-containing protein [Gammaproteobacteria bacterium]